MEIRRIICGILSILLLVGCQKVEPKEERVVCAGDSITYGFMLNPEDSYPTLLQGMLEDNYTVYNTSTVGITAYDYQNMYLMDEAKEVDPTIVILMFGSNDSNLSYYQSDEIFEGYYTKLIEEFEGSQIYLCTPCMAYSSNYGVNPKNLERIVESIKKIGKEMNLDVIDIYALTSNHEDWFGEDGIHPNKEGTLAIAQEIYEEIR